MSQTNLIANTYNPHNQTPQELIDGFVVRKKEFESLYNDVRTDRMEHPPQHAIIQGRRGSGKTTFLLRLYYEIKRDETINKWLVPLVFNEEQYNVRTLYKLWENIAVELENDYEDFSSLPDDMQARIEAPDYENICYSLLTSALQKHKKKLLLLIDNFGSMLQKFDEQEQHRLREILMTSSEIKIIGASSVALESTFDYSKPFFEFFKIVELSGLSKEETTTLLLALGEQYHKQEIKTIIAQKPGKIEALRRLTDGVPRTMILLFEIFVDDAAGDSFKDLEMVLDRVTPLYKHRMDELPAQQQELVDIIALQWDAVAVKEIAVKAHMESKAVSAQLRMLEKNRIVIKKTTSTKNHLYQISERFFNIWYLMRYGRKKEKTQVLWLTRFLEEWCDREELVERAKSHLKALQSNTLYEPCAYYVTEALVKTEIPYKLQDSLIKDTRSYLRKKGSQLSKEVSKSDIEISTEAEQYFNEHKYDFAIKKLRQVHLKDGRTYYHMALSFHKLGIFPKAEEYYILASNNGHSKAMNNLAMFYEYEKKDLVNAEKYFKMASEKGDKIAMFNLAIFYEEQKKDFEQALKFYKMASEKGHIGAMFNLGQFFKNKKRDLEQAEKFYKMASEKGDAGAMNNLAVLYDKEKNDSVQTEKYFKMASEKGFTLAQQNIAWFYFNKRINKTLALENSSRALKQDTSFKSKLLYALMLLWNDDIEKSAEISKPLFKDQEIFEHEHLLKNYLLLLIAKNQYNLAYRLFTESTIDLRERYRPIYYALMYFMKDTHPDEFRKMGSELEQTVMEIVEEINTMARTM